MTRKLEKVVRLIKCRIGITFLSIQKYFYEKDIFNKIKDFIKGNKEIIILTVSGITLVLGLTTFLIKRSEK